MKALRYYLLPLALGILTGACSSDDDNDVTPQGTTENPHWVVQTTTEPTDDPQWTVAPDSLLDLSSSMTFTISITDSVTTGDCLAAFMDGVCVGVAHPQTTDYGQRFMLYLNKPQNNQNTNVIIKYYNAVSQSIYTFENIATAFINDDIRGHIDAPFTLVPIVNEQYLGVVTAFVPLPDAVRNNISEADELAVFDGDECICTSGNGISYYDDKDASNPMLLVAANMVKQTRTVTVKYYSAKFKAIYVSDPIELDLSDPICYKDKVTFTREK